MTAHVEHIVTSGTFSLDGQTFDVDNNVWLIGDDIECVVIDAPHDAKAISELINGRRVIAILATHAHDDHVRAAPELKELVDAPIRVHPADMVLWNMTHTAIKPDSELHDRDEISVADITLHVLHTPGHTPGAVCFYTPELGAVFTGDTLFNGGPGATGRSYSDYDTIMESVRTKLLTLPKETVVHTGHGDSTTIEAES
jgi:glyoxylase-like metal-dependent hydrolase (beta-lactamase superfamily II)